MSTRLLESLQNAGLYDHPVEQFQLLETHISWVLLTGPYAYKIKKPVNFGFVNFSTLPLRRRYCEEELRLNRRLAPALYQDVVAITGSEDRPAINGGGEAIEFAVRMQQFAQDGLLSRMAADGRLLAGHIDALADIIADFHRTADVADMPSPFATPKQITGFAKQNFEQLRPLLTDSRQLSQIDALQAWTANAERDLQDEFVARKSVGRVRQCHGDLHLGNVALVNGEVTIFDCIEFNDELRWGDCMSEVAFLTMDLHDRGHAAFARRFLNRYLANTGDYSGLKVLTYYQVYRALVRAKVDRLRLTQSDLSEVEAEATEREYRSYIDLAVTFSRSAKPSLMITHGLSGSGKSTLAAQLVEQMGLVQIRSDIERKRIRGLAAAADSESAVMEGLYRKEVTEHTYHRLAEFAKQVIDAGFSAIVDATFLNRRQRELFSQLASRLGVHYLILDTRAPVRELQERIRRRMQAGHDPSEATRAVLQSQLENQQPIGKEEQFNVLTIDSTSTDLPGIVEAIQERCGA